MTTNLPGSEGEVTFYTNSKCPYAQRVWIALEEKGVKYTAVEIALYGSGGKPGWFMRLNPKGEVPVLKHNEKVIVESNSIIRLLTREQRFDKIVSPQSSCFADTSTTILVKPALCSSDHSGMIAAERPRCVAAHIPQDDILHDVHDMI